MRIAFVFPGQGSQSVGMLSGFADNAVVADYMARTNAALGEDLVKLIAEGPAEVLSLTVNTQPALLAASAAFYEAWIAAGGRRPDVMAGHSLGEYSALTAAGTFAFEDAVKLVRFRAQAMQEAVPVGVGGMAAVIGLDDEAVIEACREASAVGPVEPVNFNSPGQVVIAGRSDGLAKAVELLKARGCRRAIRAFWRRPVNALPNIWPKLKSALRRCRSMPTLRQSCTPPRTKSARSSRSRYRRRCSGPRL